MSPLRRIGPLVGASVSLVCNIGTMNATKSKKAKEKQTSKKARPEQPWNVILHNDWDNSMPKVVLVLKKTIPGMSYKRAAGIMYEAHSNGQAVVKR